MIAEIEEEVRRFVLVAVPSVPYLEALLLLRSREEPAWQVREVASRLYMPEEAALRLLRDIVAAGIAAQADGAFRFQPATEELRGTVAKLARSYASNLVAITDIVHSKTGRKAQVFADAFKLRKDS